MHPDLRPVMGNGASSSQGGVPAYDKRDVRSSVLEEQHDWQTEQAVAPKPETLLLQQETRKPYSGASNAGPSPSTEKDDTQAPSRQSLNSADYRKKKSSVMKDDGKSSSVMKDDRTSSVMQDDGSSSTEDERDDFKEAQPHNR